MAVIGDMLFTIAMVALAPGAVPELKLGIADIGAAADRALVGVGRLDGSGAGFVRTGIEADDLGLLGRGGLFLKQPPGVDPPGPGNHIQHILAEEQQIVGDGKQGEEVVGEVKNREGQGNHIPPGRRSRPSPG